MGKIEISKRKKKKEKKFRKKEIITTIIYLIESRELQNVKLK